jgi:hypothetical protein
VEGRPAVVTPSLIPHRHGASWFAVVRMTAEKSKVFLQDVQDIHDKTARAGSLMVLILRIYHPVNFLFSNPAP